MSTLTPHGACLLWKPELIWLNAVSDAMVAGAFFATAFVLGSLRVAAPPRCHVPQRLLGLRDLRRGLRGDPPAVDPHAVGAGLRHRGRDQRLPGADLGRDHGGTAADAAADPGAADTHSTSAGLCGARGGNQATPQRRGHGQAFSGDRGHRGPGPAGAEDGSHRPAHRRRRARLQQHSDRDHRNHRNPRRCGQGPSASRPDHQHDQRRRGDGAPT